MAVLSDTIRAQCWRGLMRYWSNLLESLSGLTKSDIQAAVNAIDSFLDTNATNINNAFPTAFKNNATTAQKALVVAVVALARYNVTALRQLLGEVD